MFNIPGYRYIRKDRKNKGGGGFMVYVRDGVNFVHRDDLECDELESVCLEVLIPHQKSLFVSYVYRSPEQLCEWYDTFERQLEKLDAISDNIIIMGDLNIDYMNLDNVNPSWKDIVKAYNLQQVVDVPTRITHTSQTLIDHVYTNRPDLVKNVEVPYKAVSDHFPVHITWGKQVMMANGGSHKSISYRVNKNFNKFDFLHDLSKDFTEISLGDDLDNAMSDMNQVLLQNIDKHAPVIQKRVKRERQPLWFTDEVKQAINDRDRYKKLRDHDNYVKCRNKAVSVIRRAKGQYYKEAMEKCNGNSGKLWKHIKDLKGNKINIHTNVLEYDNKRYTGPQDIANSLNNHFTDVAEKVLSDLPNGEEYVPSDEFSQFVANKMPNDKLKIPAMDVIEVREALSNVNVSKATGEDNLAARYLKDSAPELAGPLCKIINQSFSEGKFPTVWKCAKVIALHKGGKQSICDNYRPISILPILSKIMESHVHKTLYKHLCENNLLCVNQSGFRPLHSCQTVLTNISNDFNVAMDQGNMIGCVAADLRKAFDVISHKILLQKLGMYGCDTTCVRWFESYLSCRCQRVYFTDGVKSDLCQVKHGIPQGSILGPLCFSLYINDMPLVMPEVKVHMYADDTTIYVIGKCKSSIEKALQQALNALTSWCSSNRMVINVKKSNCMLICSPQKRRYLMDSSLNLKVSDEKLSCVNNMKILGIIFDNALSWRDHVSQMCGKLSMLIACLRQIKHCMNIKSKILFYNSYFIPVLDYCIVVWGRCGKSLLDKLFRLQKRILRTVFDDYISDAQNLLKKGNVMSIYDRVDYNTAVLVYKCIHGEAPAYLKNMFATRRIEHYNLRQQEGNLHVPKPRTSHFKQSFCYAGALTWNELPLYVKQIDNAQEFKYVCKKYYGPNGS
jgi:hypothetical protein